jgi:hypothetical protein
MQYDDYRSELTPNEVQRIRGMASRIRKKANAVLGVKPDEDSAAGAAT